MGRMLTPRELADAIGVSESSLKRWCDDGRICATRTVGGHRRITLEESIRFIRATAAPVIRPDLLGFHDAQDYLSTPPRDADAPAALLEYLQTGDALHARGLILALYLAGRSVAAIVDGPIQSAMRTLGELWMTDPAGVFIEHRASAICATALQQLQLALIGDGGRPTAVGGGPSGDSAYLSSIAATLVLTEAGYNAINLGAQTPADALVQAAIGHRATLAWLTITHPDDTRIRDDELRELAAQLGARGTRLIVGGKHPAARWPKLHPNIYYGSSMGELAAFAQGLHSGSHPEGNTPT